MSKANTRHVRLEVEQMESRLVPAAADYVRQLYTDVLHRSPADSEVNGWLQLIGGGRSGHDVAQMFLQSDEHHKLQIDGAYQKDLGRSVDSASEDRWIAVMRTGVAIEDVERSLFLSSEYQNTHLANDTFINGLYQAILGRAADSAGFQNWQTAMARGVSRDSVIRQMQFSTENLAQDVNGFYQDYLRRLASDADRIAWVNEIQSGRSSLEQAATRFLSSTEYETDYGFNDPAGPH